MKSREGTVVYADELLDKITAMAEENLSETNPGLHEEERRRRAEIIAKAALTFYVLKYNPQADFIYNPEESLAFEGETGPYLQYTYARIQSLLKRGEHRTGNPIETEYLPEEAMPLIRELQYYPEVVAEAAKKQRPSSLAHYLISCAQRFNELYQNVPFLTKQEKEKQALLELSSLCASIIKDGLQALGIEVLDEM